MVTTTQRVLVHYDSTTIVTTTQMTLVTIASSSMASTTQMVPITIASLTMATTQTVAPDPSPSLSSNSFSFPLHNVFDHIYLGELCHSSLVLEVASPIAKNDVHIEEMERLHQTSWEVVENTTVYDATATLSDDVEHDHSKLWELVKSPKISYANVTRSSLVEYDDMHEISVELLPIPTNHIVEHDDVQSSSPRGPLFVRTIDDSMVALDVMRRSHDGVVVFKQATTHIGLAQTSQIEVHSNPRIQQDMELWRRILDYEKKSAEMPFILVLTRKQKQHLKKTIVDKPYKTRSTGDNSSTDQ
jgi:hypothetical protein